MTRREERIVENIVQISQAWSRLREAGQKLKTALDPWFVLFSKGGCDDELYKRRDGKRHHGQLHLTDEEKSLIFAREIVEYRKKICWMEADLNDLCLYKVEMIKRIVGLQVLLKDVKEDFREKKEHEYMEKKPWAYAYFEKLLDELNRRVADIILNRKKENQKQKFSPRNRLKDFYN